MKTFQKIVVAHPDWEVFGGSSYVFTKILETLVDIKNVKLFVFSISALKTIKSNYFLLTLESKIKKLINIYLFNKYIFLPNKIRNYLINYLLIKSKIKNSIIITDCIIFSKLFNNLLSNNNFLYVYFHFPNVYLTNSKNTNIIEKIKNSGYGFIEKAILGTPANLNKENVTLLCNSLFTKKYVDELFDANSYVLHPPISVTKYKITINNNENLYDKFKLISIGRFVPAKNFEETLVALSMLPKELKSKVEYHIVGSLDMKVRSLNYIKKLKNIAKKFNINLNLHIHVNEQTKISLLQKGGIYIHPVHYEHFGISVVEAMAAGLPVIVHKSGGPYEDITDYGKYGLVYETVEDLTEKIELLLTDEKEWERYHKLSLERAKYYDFEKFKEKLIKIINQKL